MKKMKKLSTILLALIMLLSLCACGASSYKYADTAAAAVEEKGLAMPMEAPAAMEAYDAGYGGFASNSSGIEAGAAEKAVTGEIRVDKIIYSANASIETTKFDETVEKLSELIMQYGGFVESSSTNGGNYYSAARGYTSNRYASYTIRIPSEYFSTLMGSLSTLGNVPYSSTYTENISSQYYDTEARLTAYRTQEQTLLKMLEQATEIEDLLAIEDKLTDVRYSIESLQSTLNNWDRKVNYSTVTLDIQEVMEYTPETPVTLGQRIAAAFENGFKNAGSFLENLLLFILEALPVVIIIAVFAVVIIIVVRRARKKRAAKRAAKNSQTE